MSPEWADGFAQSAAVYVHLPFCSAICPYCDFAVVAGRDDLVDRYINAVIAEIEASESWRPLEAIYIGGGTPSHIPPHHHLRILEALDVKHGIATAAEISLEANPEDFTNDGAQGFASVGFNRISFGAQSFDGQVLSSLGRRHAPAEILDACAAARDAGFRNVSLDLIYGTPGETNESWKATVEAAADMLPDHVSCYALTVESGTPLGQSVRDGAPAPDPDVQADRYEAVFEILDLERYEVSNWSRPDFQCRYNLTVWAQGEYEAYGNGAHGYRNGVRFRNMRSVDRYIDVVEEGESPRAGADRLEDWGIELDRLFVGLRRTVGVAHGPGTKALIESDDGKRLLDAGVVETDDARLRVVNPLLTDAVLRSALGLRPPIVSIGSHA